MPDEIYLAEVHLLYERRQVLRVHDRRISASRRVRIREVVAPAVRYRSVPFGEGGNLIHPISVVADRAMNEDDRRAAARLEIMQGNAMADIDAGGPRLCSRRCSPGRAAKGPQGSHEREPEDGLQHTPPVR